MNQRYLQHQQLVRRDVVVLDRLSVRYQDRVVLQDFSLHIFDGQSAAILGATGTGKTLLLACLQGLVQPRSGHMTLFGTPVPPISRDIRRHIGVMPQMLQERDETMIQDTLHMAARQYGVQLQPSQLEDYARRFELALTQPIAQLTPLQRRVLTLALSTIHDPKIVLLDEPLSGLSESECRIVDSYVKQMQREGRSLIVTFEPPVASMYLSAYDVIVTLQY